MTQVDKERLSVVQIQNTALETKLGQLQQELRDAKDTQTPVNTAKIDTNAKLETNNYCIHFC